MKYVVKTFHGLEETLCEELRELGAKEVVAQKRAVAFGGDLETLYKANLHLRTALRILQPIHAFQALNERQLYRRIMDFDWSEYLGLKQTFAIDSIVFSNRFRHSQYVALKMKDAIVDQFRKKTGKRPSVDTRNPDVRFSVHVNHTHFTLSIDSSGDSLHKRGYRKQGHRAPLNEVLAAGMIRISGWDKKSPLIDPMCGTGTIPMEAALMAANIPPGLSRKNFAFMNWKSFQPAIWSKVLKEARKQQNYEVGPIIGSDMSAKAIAICKESAALAKLDKYVSFRQMPLDQFKTEYEEGWLIINPPYGERLEKADINQFYNEMGSHLKHHFTGFQAWILSSNREALKFVGLKPSRKLTLFNGALECKFQQYELYAGSRKKNGQTADG